MQLHATNAIVMTRSHGVRVPGFEVVSEQMRQLSKELGSCLAELRSATVQWLRWVSHRIATERSVDILHVTARIDPTVGLAVERVLAKLADDRDADTTIRISRRAFVIVLDDARRLAATGCVLARAAKLEATYGHEVADKLAESAAAFTVLADSVDEAVRAIARRLAAGQQRTP